MKYLDKDDHWGFYLTSIIIILVSLNIGLYFQYKIIGLSDKEYINLVLEPFSSIFHWFFN